MSVPNCALGFSLSHSRPRVSNDYLHTDALFRTAKYHHSLPYQGFAELGEARRWAASFVHAYIHQHRHSALRIVTPAQNHAGEDRAILARRKPGYGNRRSHSPERWVRNTTRNGKTVTFTTLRPIDPQDLNLLRNKST